MRKWQSPYELLRRQNPAHSYIEFANIRKFASKSYENILLPFSDEIHASDIKFSSDFSHLLAAIGFGYQNATLACISFFEQKIEQSATLYEQNPERFSLYTPSLVEIKERLEGDFRVYEIQNMMRGNTNIVGKNYRAILKSFKGIAQEHKVFIESRKERHIKTIELLEGHVAGVYFSLANTSID